MTADPKDVLTEMLARAFPLATGEQLSRSTEQFRKIVDNERRRSAQAERIMILAHLRNTGHFAAYDTVKELPRE